MANDAALHIIAFDVPYPPNYGGVIDIFYKIRALQEIGVKVTLHAFVYGDRQPQPELEQYCATVHYYSREERLLTHMSVLPYIVRSRRNPDLLVNLLADDHPILFEGLHSCAYLDHPKLRSRKKLVRMHNIEWKYYLDLIPKAPSLKHKAYYFVESYKLKQYESVLTHAQHIFSVSDDETEYCRVFANASWLPAFHGNGVVGFKPSSPEDRYVIFHGNLDITDNQEAVKLLDEICGELNVKCVVTGKCTASSFALRSSHLVPNPSGPQIQELIENAQACFVHSAFANGVKLKLLYSLFSGRFVIANQACVTGTRLGELAVLANTREEIKAAIKNCVDMEFTEAEFERRKILLQQYYDNGKNAELIRMQL